MVHIWFILVIKILLCSFSNINKIKVLLIVLFSFENMLLNGIVVAVKPGSH